MKSQKHTHIQKIEHKGRINPLKGVLSMHDGRRDSRNNGKKDNSFTKYVYMDYSNDRTNERMKDWMDE